MNGTSDSKEASVGGRVSPVSAPLDEMAQTYAEGCMSSGAPWYVSSKDGSLKILGPILMSG
jgi:hypothetical protein